MLEKMRADGLAPTKKAVYTKVFAATGRGRSYLRRYGSIRQILEELPEEYRVVRDAARAERERDVAEQVRDMIARLEREQEQAGGLVYAAAVARALGRSTTYLMEYPAVRALLKSLPKANGYVATPGAVVHVKKSRSR